MNKSFIKIIEEAQNHQNELHKTYISIIDLVNVLKTKSKIYMNRISDLEGGLNKTASDLQMKESIEKISFKIDSFNGKMPHAISDFERKINAITLLCYNGLNVFEEQKEERLLLVKSKKELLYLEALIRKFRSKIASLQRMSNILLSLSEEQITVKNQYKSNLSKANTLLTNASESILLLLGEVDNKLK